MKGFRGIGKPIAPASPPSGRGRGETGEYWYLRGGCRRRKLGRRSTQNGKEEEEEEGWGVESWRRGGEV